MTRVALLWHMHQPYYEDLVTREHILPWVRLHALKDYYGMVALLREFPEVRTTFNLVPSLLVQLEAFAANRAHDRYLELGLKPSENLTDDDAAFILLNFFHAQRQRMIEIYPRYAELLARRGTLTSLADARAAAQSFDRDDLRDLQIWQKLAWIDPLYYERDERVRALVAKGRRFSEDDKQVLRAVELELLSAVIPEYRDAATRGQIEISASPFYHPILPLLCDTDAYKATHPTGFTALRQRFAHPEDALEQLNRAAELHEQLFGRRPTGLWPSEGSVSDAMAPLVVDAGFEWMATDELILARTLGLDLTRDGDGYLHSPERLYTPYTLSTGKARLACFFRDHVLSDLIGFTYASWPAEAAADDFVRRLAEAGRRHAARTGGGEAVIPIILDGENAWEHFEGGGRPFLRALYRRLSDHFELKTVTMAEASRVGGPTITTIFPGSWIDANFYIWIGHQDDQRAWSQLGDAREALQSVDSASPAAARAREEIFIAEGSDWFWWYGDDHSSDQDPEFDDLFRRHLRNVYRLIDKPVPDELFLTNISTATAGPSTEPPIALVSPAIDGEETSYFEWLGAGRFDPPDHAGTMHRADASRPEISQVRFGFDIAHFFLRVDCSVPVADLLAKGYEFALIFFKPEGVHLLVNGTGSAGATGRLRRRGPDSGRSADLPHQVRVAARAILEVATPLANLGLTGGQPLSFSVALLDAQNHEIDRQPAARPLETAAPDQLFAARNWTA